jgi:hypothetical protein
MGDSHASVFHWIKKHDMLLNYCIQRIVIVPGATAQGMVNPNTKTNALRIFHESLNEFPHNLTVTLLLGEVDTGFVV